MLDEVARMFPAERGDNMHPNTIRSWITKGVHGVRLLAWKPGKRWYTTPEAVQQFLDAIRNAKSDASKDVRIDNSRQRRRAVKQAAARHGLKPRRK